jgi:predicted nucleotidyltransferase
MITKEIILKELQNRQQFLHEKFGVEKIGLFGSFIHNKNTPSSDIDILITFKNPGFDAYMDCKFYLEKIFNCGIDLVIESDLKPELKPYILKEVEFAQR